MVYTFQIHNTITASMLAVVFSTGNATLPKKRGHQHGIHTAFQKPVAVAESVDGRTLDVP
jgi:hypothetical protein